MGKNSEYLPRIIDTQIEKQLAASGAVLIEGPKWCGKTWAARHIAHSVLYLQDSDKSANYLQIAKDKPSLLLQGEPPLLIDEWQMAPVLWDAVRFAVDTRGVVGQFLLTGSAVPLDNAVMHTGTGRISRLYMRPMSLYESLESNGAVSLGELFAGVDDISGISKLTIEDFAFIVSRGGWPASVTDEKSVALRRVNTYIEAVINYDVSRVDGIEKKPERVRKLLQSLARNSASMATIGTITADVSANDGDVSEKTISKYLTALRRIFVIEDACMASGITLKDDDSQFFQTPFCRPVACNCRSACHS
ncbi:MAG TPA: AAA family ATPase [Methanocorpusculum sp.]|nr:AAA family ATPase [Methanocorpusculum sp.]